MEHVTFLHGIAVVMISLGCQSDWVWSQLTGNRLRQLGGELPIRLSEVRRAILNVDSTFRGQPTLERVRRKASLLASLCLCLSHEFTYPVTMASAEPAPVGFQCQLKTRSSLGILQSFNVRLGLLGHPALWTKQLCTLPCV